MDSYVDFSTLKVLVIDDERYARETAQALLQRVGVAKINTANSGLAGLTMLQSMRPTLILCDIHMSPVDGLEFVTRLRANEDVRLAKTPVILLTADSNKATIQSAREVGANSYLVKPVELNGLKSRIGSVLTGKASI